MAKSLIGKILDLAGPIPHADVFHSRSGLAYGGNLASDRQTHLQQMSAQGTLYSIVQLLSTGTSAHEWHMFRQNSDNRVRYVPPDGSTAVNENRVEVVQHQALKLWKQPNDFMDGAMFREIGLQFLELVGEWYWVLDRGPSGTGVPLEMWPVRPDRMEPVPDRDKFLKGWVYTGPNGEQVPLDHEEVIQLRYPDPTDMYRGLSAVQSILVDIDSAKYTAEWSRNFFLNSATPGGIVQFSKRLSDDEFDEFTYRWRESHQGVSRGHRVGILEQGAIWVPNTYSLREMQFAELRSVNREVIREAYRIHSAMLGLSEDVNRANAQTGAEVHVVWQEIPRLRRIRGTLNGRYLGMFGATGQGVEFDFDDPTPHSEEEDSASLVQRSNAAAVLIKAGFDAKKVLVTCGLPDMTWVPPVPPQAPRPALPPGNAPGESGALPGATPDEEAAAMRDLGRVIRSAFREGRFQEPDYDAMAAMLRAELPARTNGKALAR